MSEQIFISYRREGGDVTAKLICEKLKNCGYTVFYDYDSLSGGYFDSRILDAIEKCQDFILVLPPHSLDRCVNEEDWVRKEIKHALQCKKNIVPLMLPGFEFPRELPGDIAEVTRFNGVQFVMAYFDSVMETVVDHLTSQPVKRPVSMGATNPVNTAPLAPSANLEFKYDDSLKGYTVKMGKCTDTQVVIPASYQGKAVVGIAKNGFRDCSAITHVHLPNSIREIGENGFYRCASLESITLPESVTEVGKWAFYECTSLTYAYIPWKVNTIGMRAFTGCTALKQFTVDENSSYYCTQGGHLFEKDMKTMVAYAAGCTSASFNVPRGVTKIEDSCFSRCAFLEAVTLPETLINMGEFVFYECTSLRSINLPDGMPFISDSSFKKCSSLRHIHLPTATFKIGESAFEGCVKLENLTLPQGISEIGKWAFYECETFTQMHIPADVRYIGARAFTGCTRLPKFTVDAKNEHYCAIDGHLYTRDMRTFLAYAPADPSMSYTLRGNVSRIEDSSFSRCTNLVNVVIPDSVKFFGDFVFYNCSNLQTVKLPAQVYEMGKYTFKACSSLQKADVPAGTQAIGEDMFRECSSLTSVTIPKSVTSIGKCAFYRCKQLQAVTLPDNVTSIGKWAFYECTSLKAVTIPKGVMNIEQRAFANCTSITKFGASIFNKAYKVKGSHLYTKDMKTLVSYALACRDNHFDVPGSVTRIEDSAISKCAHIATITLPAGLTSIGDFGMDGCTCLRDIRFLGTSDMWKRITIGEYALRKISAPMIMCSDGIAKL